MSSEDRAAREEELSRRSQELSLLCDAGRVLSRTLDPHAVYDALQELVAGIMPCDGLLVSTYDPDDNLIRCAYAWVEGERPDVSCFPPIPLAPAGRGMQSIVIRGGEPLLIQDTRAQSQTGNRSYYLDPDGTIHDQPSEGSEHTQCALMVPIRLEGRVLGTVQVMSNRKGSYTDDHLRILEALVLQMAAASRNAFLYQRAREEIAEREQAEAALRESEARFRQLAENVRSVFWLSDPQQQRVEYVSPAYEEVWGREARSLYERLDSLLESIHPQDRDRVGDSIERQRQGERTELEYRILRPDGTTRWIWDRGFPIRDDEGRVYRVAGIAEDITARKRAEQRGAAFQALGQRLNSATSSEEAARITLQVADDLLGWDACWLELWDRESERRHTVLNVDVIDGRRTEVASPYPDALASARARQTIEKGPSLELREPAALVMRGLPYGDISRPSASLMFAPIRGRAGVTGALSIQSYRFNAYTQEDLVTLQALADYCGDALERTSSEGERRELEGQLRHSQKMEAIGRLAGSVAHDFNNVISVINVYTDLLCRGESLTDAARQSLEEIRKATEKASGLTQQLLAFSRRQIITLEILNLNQVVSGTENLLRRLIGESIELVTSLDPDLGQLEADAGQLNQILINLAVNARDAMPEGGRLVIATANLDLGEDGPCAHADLRPGRYVVLSVSDSGCGMDAETRARLFEPFFTTKPEGEGTGLGLATVYGIVKQAGGHIDVESEPCHGATFRIYLPCVEIRAPIAEQPDAAAGPGSRSGTILLVEDEEMVRKLARAVLQESGYRVIEARRADEAIGICEARGAEIDLLLTDVVMPGGMSGGDLVERIATLHPGVKVLYMSAHANDTTAGHGALPGEATFLQKPFSPRLLTQRVRELLG
jgi:two-component system cell cycle sensor histidine kinase/response regulator CckA